MSGMSGSGSRTSRKQRAMTVLTPHALAQPTASLDLISNVLVELTNIRIETNPRAHPSL